MSVDVSKVPAGEVVDLTYEHISPGEFLLRGAASTSITFQNQADTARRTPHEVYVSALLGAVEMLTNGITAVIDHFAEQGFSLEHVDAVARAYKEVGMRAAICFVFASITAPPSGYA